jgi:adenylate cyclase
MAKVKAIEIERKFLVRNDGWRRCATDPHVLQQVYLSRRDQSSVRVRLTDGVSAHLTIKFRTLRFTKQEYEYEIPVDEALDLLSVNGHVLEKTRYHVVHGGKNWYIDVFGGRYEGLTLAEVEISSEDEHPELPQWLGREVTGKKQYSNRAMAAALRVSSVAQQDATAEVSRRRHSSWHPD